MVVALLRVRHVQVGDATRAAIPKEGTIAPLQPALDRAVRHDLFEGCPLMQRLRVVVLCGLVVGGGELLADTPEVEAFTAGLLWRLLVGGGYLSATIWLGGAAFLDVPAEFRAGVLDLVVRAGQEELLADIAAAVDLGELPGPVIALPLRGGRCAPRCRSCRGR